VGASSLLSLGQNLHWDSDNSWEYISTDEASILMLRDGGFEFQTVPSGTAGTDLTKTTRFQIVEAGDVTVSTGNLVIGTAGKGIDFSAQTPAAGMTAELLDHYEEGTCTLTCKGSSADPTSAVTETAAYTRVGRQVTVTCYFNNKDTSGASGDWYFAGLPFTSANEAVQGE